MTPLIPVVGALLAGWWLRGQDQKRAPVSGVPALAGTLHPAFAAPGRSGSPSLPAIEATSLPAFGKDSHSQGAVRAKRILATKRYAKRAHTASRIWSIRAERAAAAGNHRAYVKAQNMALKAAGKGTVAQRNLYALLAQNHDTGFGGQVRDLRKTVAYYRQERANAARGAKRALRQARRWAERDPGSYEAHMWTGAYKRAAARAQDADRMLRRLLRQYHAAGGKLWAGQTALGGNIALPPGAPHTGVTFPGENLNWSPDHMAARNLGWGGGTEFNTGFGWEK